MGTKSWKSADDTSSARIVGETKESVFSLRRFLHPDSFQRMQEISTAIDKSGEILERGMVYIPRYIRFTIFGTQEIPAGKRHCMQEVVSRVESCGRPMQVELGGFIVSQVGDDKPKLALEVFSKAARKENETLRTVLECMNMTLREPKNGPRVPHISIAELDRDQVDCGEFGHEKLMKLNESAGAVITDARVYLGKILLRPVSLPKK